MEKIELKEGDVVQLSPFDVGNPMFAGCMMVVTEPKEWARRVTCKGLVPMGIPQAKRTTAQNGLKWNLSAKLCGRSNK